MFILTRKLFGDNFIRDGPTGCVGVGNKSWWQTEETSISSMKHFISYAHSSPENLKPLILDSNSSHISCEVLDICKKNVAIRLLFPPHCLHHLQPSDVSVYRSFKARCVIGISSWLKSHPGKNFFTIFDLVEIKKQAFHHLLTPSNINMDLWKPEFHHTFQIYIYIYAHARTKMIILPQHSSQTGQV